MVYICLACISVTFLGFSTMLNSLDFGEDVSISHVSIERTNYEKHHSGRTIPPELSQPWFGS